MKKRFELYKEIITNIDNKILAYTYVKEFVKVPISDNMIKYMLKSTNFHDILSVWKNVYTYIDYDPKTKKLVYKENRRPNRIPVSIGFCIFFSPLLFFIVFLDKLICYDKYLFSWTALAISCAIVAFVIFLNEIGDKTLAISLMEKMNGKEERVFSNKSSSPSLQ